MSRRELERELEAMVTVQGKLREILVGVAEALKGPHDPRNPHDWSDLPELARKLATEHRHLRAWWEDHMSRTGDAFEQIAVDMAEVKKQATAEGFRRGMEAMRQLATEGLIPRIQSHEELYEMARLSPVTETVDPDEVL